AGRNRTSERGGACGAGHEGLDDRNGNRDRSIGRARRKMKSLAPAEIVTEVEATVFAEPGEARAFAIALTLSGGKGFSWNEFRERLIAEIAQADAAHAGGAGTDANPR